MVFSNTLLMGGAIANASTGYTINNAIWTASGDYLSTSSPGAGTSDQVMTVGGWYKVTSDADNVALFAWTRTTNTNDYVRLGINSDGTIRLVLQNTSDATRLDWTTSAVYRDPTAWMHVVWTVSTNGEAVNQFWVNGVEITAFTKTTDSLTSGDQFRFGNSSHNHTLFSDPNGSDNQGAIYAAQVFYQDGQKCTDITNYGEFDARGNWRPIDLSGLTYGTNGYLLEFATTPGTGAGSGDDTSGNANDLTENSMTAAQQVEDTPVDSSADEVGNRAVFNSLYSYVDSGATLTNGNTSFAYSGTNSAETWGTVAVQDDDNGKWVICATINRGVTNSAYFGFSTPGDISADMGSKTNEFVYRGYNDDVFIDGTGQTAITGGDEVRIEWDTTSSSNNVEVFTDGVSRATYTWNPTGPISLVAGRAAGSATCDLIIDTADMAGTVTSGFKILSTENLPAPTVTDPSAYFQSVLYTGNGTAIGSGGNAITLGGNATMQPDFVWIKNRDAADEHMIYDAVRGATKDINSDSTSAEATDTEGLSTFDSDGFTVGSNVAVNTNTEKYVAWCLKAGGSGSSNTDGTENSTVSVADHNGFAIVSWTNNATPGTGDTVGHGMGQAPEMLILKSRDDTADGWHVWHKDLTSIGYYLKLNNTNAEATDSGNAWDGTAPTSSVFSIGDGDGTNWTNTANHDMIAYCFARTPGLIGIGSYTGNGSADGPYVVVDDGNVGFRPAFVLIKDIDDGTVDWWLWDAVRGTYNPVTPRLTVNLNSAENNLTDAIDFTANGFKLRDGTTAWNKSGSTHIYLAFAEFPFGGSGVAQARAR